MISGSRKRVFMVAAVVAVALGAALAVKAAADTAITITSPGCSGSGGGAEFCFNPEAASGQTGVKVTWTNMSAGAPHNLATCDSMNCPGAPASTGSDTFNNVAINGSDGSTGSFTFSHAGTYYYYCTIHTYANMHGSITIATASPPPRVPEFLTPVLGAGAGLGVLLLVWQRRRSKPDRSASDV